MTRLTKGFTLIELIVVVAVLSILAAVLVPQVANIVEDARISRVETELNTFKKAITKLYADIGRFPADQGANVDPGLNYRNRVPSTYRVNWRGPYLDRWPSSGHPWGGAFDYEYWTRTNMNYNGTAGDEVLISIRYGLNATICNKIDRDMDNNARSSGNVQHDINNWLGYYVGEGPRW
jgi:general secretion pathway protein G